MIYTYKNYRDIKEFYEGTSSNSREHQFTIVQKCKGCDKNRNFTSDCFGCLFCAVNDSRMVDALINHFEIDFVKEVAKNAFKGIPVKIHLRPKGIRHQYTSLEQFTSVDETTNIQPWATGLLHYMCSRQNRISMEVPVFNMGYDRNGRLDICSVTDRHMIVLESKTTIDNALMDERFVEQHKKYTEVIDEITGDYTYLTLVGGKDTDIYPEDSEYCTGSTGGKASRFLRILRSNGIQVITANALWCLCCKYLKEGEKFSWDNFIVTLFSNPECIGLVSAGAIMLKNGKPTIIPLV